MVMGGGKHAAPTGWYKFHVLTSDVVCDAGPGQPSGKGLVTAICGNTRVIVTRQKTTHFQPCNENLHVPSDIAPLVTGSDVAAHNTDHQAS